MKSTQHSVWGTARAQRSGSLPVLCEAWVSLCSSVPVEIKAQCRRKTPVSGHSLPSCLLSQLPPGTWISESSRAGDAHELGEELPQGVLALSREGREGREGRARTQGWGLIPGLGVARASS